MNHVLLIDDDVELVGMFSEYLEQEGFRTTCVYNGHDGAREALRGDYAIAILDVMMPGTNGIDALRRIRGAGTGCSRIPILMLTARGDDADRILGLELGADDYVAKPCTPRELTARVRAILRRTQASADAGLGAVLMVGKLGMYPEQRRATWDGAAVDLTSTEFNLLEVLARHAGRPVSKNELSEQGLGRPLARFDRNIDVHLSSLRQKLGLLSDGRSPLQTIYRQGYQLIRD
ncbi:MAG: response regulator transcription factor [Lysobacteraceae bacterium]|nr:MAG: response regulator transcription factor [Xanthomonadaceae bacterium]